nr:HAMP domain-containing sensor histidine kinase [Conyzicola lurida]
MGLVGGWLLAGRMLRPLQRINGVARRVSDGSLDDRVRLDGPRDEFRELADTFDSMLDRLQGSLDEQRRFAANAAHELRTPYAIERSMLDVALADPAGIDLARLLLRLDETNRRGIEVVGALLALASLDDPAGLVRDPVDVAEIVSGVVDELRPAATAAGLTIDSEIGEGDIDGSATLVRQLVGNLVLNGIRHNLPGGWVTVRTSTGPRGTVQLEVANSGGVVSPSLLGTLTEPFVRGAGRVARAPGAGSAPEGSGLGLALVARIAEVHGAVLRLEAPPTGGLVAHVVFPAPR